MRSLNGFDLSMIIWCVAASLQHPQKWNLFAIATNSFILDRRRSQFGKVRSLFLKIIY